MQSETPFVAVVGGANVDIHGRPQGRLVAHDSNPGDVRVSAGGVARNVAENLARLGIDTQLVSAVGADEHGRMLLQSCRDAGIGMRCVQRIESAPTSTYLSILDNRGEMQVAVSDMRILEQLNAARLQACQDMLNRAALIVIDTNLPGDALAWLMDTYAERTLFVDTVSTAKAPRIRQYLDAIHSLKLSRLEAEVLSGMPAANESQLRDIARWAHARGVERLFITLGEAGAFYSAGGSQGTCRLDADDIYNTGGAGDAFLAALVCAWLESRPIEQSVRFALAAAAVTLAHPGANNPELSLETINARLDNPRDQCRE